MHSLLQEYDSLTVHVFCCCEQMYFENAYCINCWYKDLDQPFIKYPPFVIHYAGCQMCTGVSSPICVLTAQVLVTSRIYTIPAVWYAAQPSPPPCSAPLWLACSPTET